jgi:hypothetical protein
MSFYILPSADDTETTAYRKQRCVYKVKKYIKEHNAPRHGLGGLHHKEGRDE